MREGRGDVFANRLLRLVPPGFNADPLENPESYLRRSAINAALDVDPIAGKGARGGGKTPQKRKTIFPGREFIFM